MFVYTYRKMIGLFLLKHNYIVSITVFLQHSYHTGSLIYFRYGIGFSVCIALDYNIVLLCLGGREGQHGYCFSLLSLLNGWFLTLKDIFVR